MRPALPGRCADMRFLLGAWRWMFLVGAVLDDGQRVVVVTSQGARSAFAATRER